MRNRSGFRQLCVRYDPKFEFSISVLNGQNLNKILQVIVTDERKVTTMNKTKDKWLQCLILKILMQNWICSVNSYPFFLGAVSRRSAFTTTYQLLVSSYFFFKHIMSLGVTPVLFRCDIDVKNFLESSFIFSKVFMQYANQSCFTEVSKSMHVWKSSFNHIHNYNILFGGWRLSSFALCCVV